VQPFSLILEKCYLKISIKVKIIFHVHIMLIFSRASFHEKYDYMWPTRK
jgi:hypothetical protein